MANIYGERSWPRRIIYGSLWAVGFFVFTRIVIGSIVGYIAGLNLKTGNFATGAAVGYWASVNFFKEFGWIILFVQVSIFAVLCFYGLLPGVGRHKRRSETSSSGPPPPEVYGLGPEPHGAEHHE